MWTLKGYVTSGGRNELQTWYEDAGAKVQAKFDARWRYLRAQPSYGAWIRPYFGRLKGECSSFGEIRLEVENVQYRPIGWPGPFGNDFTVVICAKEKDGQFRPISTCQTAKKRRDEILKDRSRAREPRFIQESF